ncbi:MAG: leucyl-tRNA--protein transferase [Treponema sp.]|jgi:Leu/Phe-tRNA-protein transferase|nr:leucyl-tRNA--protein transferase [Treponema sp.]
MPGAGLRYLPSGYAFISPGDDLDAVVDAMLETGYNEEFCVAADFDPPFVADLMGAGFLVMSARLDGEEEEGAAGNRYAKRRRDRERSFILLPKLHLERSILLFPDLHIKRSVRRFLPRYELRADADFECILEGCALIHGEDWLTLPLRRSLIRIRSAGNPPVRPVSFGVYREGKLRAGEVGVITGRVYTSYSGWYEEDSAGTVQLVLMTEYLRDAGFAFLDLGMPMEYKDKLGARNVDPRRFVELFRSGRIC